MSDTERIQAQADVVARRLAELAEHPEDSDVRRLALQAIRALRRLRERRLL